jgi:hypothetical protein
MVTYYQYKNVAVVAVIGPGGGSLLLPNGNEFKANYEVSVICYCYQDFLWTGTAEYSEKVSAGSGKRLWIYHLRRQSDIIQLSIPDNDQFPALRHYGKKTSPPVDETTTVYAKSNLAYPYLQL